MLIRWLMRQFSSVAPDPVMLDHVPVNKAAGAAAPCPRAEGIGQGLTHEQKIALASERLGKAFKCAPDGVPREIKRGPGILDVVVRIEDLAEAWDAANDEERSRQPIQPRDVSRNVAPMTRKNR